MQKVSTRPICTPTSGEIQCPRDDDVRRSRVFTCHALPNRASASHSLGSLQSRAVLCLSIDGLPQCVRFLSMDFTVQVQTLFHH